MSMIVIEDALIDLVKNNFSDRLKEVAALPGQWSAETIKYLIANAPAIYIAWLGNRGATPSANMAQANDSWALYCVSKNARGHEAQRRGDKSEIGCAEMLEIAIPLVNGFDVPEVGSLRFSRADNLFSYTLSKQGITVYAAIFELHRAYTLPDVTSTLENFTTFHQNIDMAPADGQTDVSQTDALPQE